jgi:hypothetical protein
MRIAIIHDSFEASKLDRVVEQMKVLGPPKLRAVWCEDRGFWAALEGCHRTRAAAKLGLTPIIVPVEYKPGMTWQDIGMGPETEGYLITLDEVMQMAGSERVIGFGEDGPPDPCTIRRPGPGEVFTYRIIRDIGFDFGGRIVTGVGTTFTSKETFGKDVTDFVTMHYLEIVSPPATVGGPSLAGGSPPSRLPGEQEGEGNGQV